MAALLTSMFSEDLPTPDRLRVLSEYFKPKFHEVLELHPEEVAHLKFKEDPFQARGFVVVSPPKGRCFIVRRSEYVRDNLVCSPTTLSFRLTDLNYSGKINWQVFTGKGDFGTKVSWQTPYRLGQIISAYAKKKNVSKLTMITGCEVSQEPYRQVTLTTMRGKKWLIRFPEFDTLMPQPLEGPNLYYDTGQTNKNLFSQASDLAQSSAEAMKAQIAEKEAAKKEAEKSSGKKPKKESQKSSSEEGQSLGGNFSALFKRKKVEKKYVWSLTPKNTYEMSAGNLTVDGGPKGGDGFCRYRFVGAPHDKENGLIECKGSADFEAILAPLVCAQSLGRPKPTKK